MSKYTTEVRYICEKLANYDESKGADAIDSILEKCWNKIFTSTPTIFDEAYRKIICKKILKHFYLREIGAETFGIWKFWMNTKMEELLPYYNQLWKSELLEFNPLYDVDVTKTYTKTGDTDTTNTNTVNKSGSSSTDESGSTDSTDKVTNTTTGTTDTTTTNTSNKKDRYSDTPQGTLSNIESNTYLTNARIIDETNSGTSNTTIENNSTTDDTYAETRGNKTENSFENEEKGNNTGTINSTEEYTDHIIGKTASGSYSEMLLKFRETFLNIDMMFINEFEELFMGLW